MRMNDLTVVDSIYLDAQQKEDVRRLSSLGYSSKDIAVSLGLSPEDVGLFVRDAETVGPHGPRSPRMLRLRRRR